MKRKIFEIGSEYDWDSNSGYLLKEENDFALTLRNQNFKFLRSGRDALRCIAEMCKHTHQVVLMPALVCSCMPEPFERDGYSVVYYKLNQDFTIDIEDVKRKLVENCIFLYMNYFGTIAITKEQKRDLKKNKRNVLVVEDITHDFLKRRNDIFDNDYTVCSIRKWFAIPDGGLLISSQPLNDIKIEEDKYFGLLRKEAMIYKSTYLCGGEMHLKDKYRLLLAESNNFIDTVQNLANIHEQSERLAKHMDYETITQIRSRNVEELQKEIPPLNIDCNNSTLYFPIDTKGRQSEIQKKMAEHGVYMPVIWPLPEKAVGICSVADYIAENMLAIPCDHRYDLDDMRKICEIYKGII